MNDDEILRSSAAAVNRLAYKKLRDAHGLDNDAAREVELVKAGLLLRAKREFEIHLKALEQET